MDEIPDASAQASLEEEMTLEEKQVRECTEAVKSINARCPSVTLYFKIPLQDSIRDNLISKGFVVKYTLEYDSAMFPGSHYKCRVRITNPKLARTSEASNPLANLLGQLSAASDSQGDRAFYSMASGFLRDSDIFCDQK